MKKLLRNALLSLLTLGALLALPRAAVAETVTLQWWDYLKDSAGDLKGVDDLIAGYQASHPNVKIERTSVAFGDLKTKIIQAAATGTMPDIVIIDNPDHQAMAAQGALADVTALVKGWKAKDQYFAGPWSSTVYQGKNYGVPYKSNATALFYNEDLLAAAGIKSPPKTWDELQKAAKALTKGNVSGFCFSAVNTEEGTFTILPFLWASGGDIPTIGDAASVETLKFLNTLVNVDKSVPASVSTLSQGDVNNLFMAGQCAMMINGPWQIPGIKANANVKFKWAVSGWPYKAKPVSILGGENFAIGANSHVKEAWDVIVWAVQPEHLIPALKTHGQFPGRKDVATDPYFTSDPIQKAFSQAVSVAKPRAYGPNYPKMSEEIMRMVSGVLSGAETPEQAAAAAAKVIKPLASK
jgi:multiple sugar transport system substrate-binding protein